MQHPVFLWICPSASEPHDSPRDLFLGVSFDVSVRSMQSAVACKGLTTCARVVLCRVSATTPRRSFQVSLSNPNPERRSSGLRWVQTHKPYRVDGMEMGETIGGVRGRRNRTREPCLQKQGGMGSRGWNMNGMPLFRGDGHPPWQDVAHRFTITWMEDGWSCVGNHTLHQSCKAHEMDGTNRKKKDGWEDDQTNPTWSLTYTKAKEQNNPMEK